MLPVSKKISDGLENNVLKKMSYDEVSMTVWNDDLILRFGEKLYYKHGHLEHLGSYILVRKCVNWEDLSYMLGIAAETYNIL